MRLVLSCRQAPLCAPPLAQSPSPARESPAGTFLAVLPPGGHPPCPRRGLPRPALNLVGSPTYHQRARACGGAPLAGESLRGCRTCAGPRLRQPQPPPLHPQGGHSPKTTPTARTCPVAVPQRPLTLLLQHGYESFTPGMGGPCWRVWTGLCRSTPGRRRGCGGCCCRSTGSLKRRGEPQGPAPTPSPRMKFSRTSSPPPRPRLAWDPPLRTLPPPHPRELPSASPNRGHDRRRAMRSREGGCSTFSACAEPPPPRLPFPPSPPPPLPTRHLVLVAEEAGEGEVHPLPLQTHLRLLRPPLRPRLLQSPTGLQSTRTPNSLMSTRRGFFVWIPFFYSSKFVLS
eukprot:Hpha_TRINITY_DN228_c0_g1::TRINITY_DN228_c0_g1_i1::g.83617::m.83617